MKLFRKPLAASQVFMLLTAVLAIGLSGNRSAAQGKKGSGNAPTEAKKTLLLFPFDFSDTSVSNASDISMLLLDVAHSHLLAAGTYSVTQFYKSLPPVARLHNDQQLSDSDVNPPYAEDNVKAVKIAKLTDYDVVFVGGVDSYTYNSADKQVEMTVSGRLLDVTTGKILKSATLTATSSKGGNAKQDDRGLEAARDAGEKLLAQLVPLPPPTATGTGKTSKPAKKSGGKSHPGNLR